MTRSVALISAGIALMAFARLAVTAAAEGAALCKKKNGLVMLRSNCMAGE